MWAGLVSLETLQLTGNKFRSLPSDAFSNLPELKTLIVGLSIVVLEKEKFFDPSTFPSSKKQPPRIGLEEDGNFLVCNSSNCWLKRIEEKGMLVHYQKNGRPSRPKCSDKPGLYWDEVDLKCPGKNRLSKRRNNSYFSKILTQIRKTHIDIDFKNCLCLSTFLFIRQNGRQSGGNNERQCPAILCRIYRKSCRLFVLYCHHLLYA